MEFTRSKWIVLLMVLSIIIIHKQAFSIENDSSPLRKLAEYILNSIPDTNGILIVGYPSVYDTLKMINAEMDIKRRLKIVPYTKTIVEKLPYIKGKIPIYTLGICNIEPYIKVDSLSTWGGIVDLYNPSGKNTIDTSYKIILNGDLSFFDDPIYWSDTMYCYRIYSLSAQLGNGITNIYGALLGEGEVERADSLVKKMKPYFKNVPTFPVLLLKLAFDNDSTSIHGISTDTLIEILQDWCDRNQNTFIFPLIDSFLKKFKMEQLQLKQRKLPNP